MPERLRAYLVSPPGLRLPERAFYATLARAGGLLTDPVLAPLAQVPGRGAGRGVVLRAVRAELKGLQLLFGSYRPSEEAAPYRFEIGRPRRVQAKCPAWR